MCLNEMLFVSGKENRAIIKFACRLPRSQRDNIKGITVFNQLSLRIEMYAVI